MNKSSVTKASAATPKHKPNRKLTDFWQRNQPSASSDQMGLTHSSISGPSADARRAAADTRKTAPEHEVLSVDSRSDSNPTNIRSVTCISSDSHHSPPPHSVPSSAKSSPRTRSRYRRQGLPQSSNIPLKRPHSPKVQILPPPRKLSPVKSSTKRKRMFDLDSDVEILDTVIYVPKAPTASKENIPTIRKSINKPSPSKRRRTSSARSVHYVPSSQSDEHELAVPKPPPDPTIVKESIHKWRKDMAEAQTRRRPPLHNDFDMDDDLVSVSAVVDTNICLQSPNSDHNVIIRNGDMSTVMISTISPPSTKSTPVSRFPDNDYHPLSPPPSDPPTEFDTAQVIAKMKAEALAAASREEENIPDQTLDLPDSSSDESDNTEFMGLNKPLTRDSSSKSSAAHVPALPATFRRSRRLMERSPSPIDSSSASTGHLKTVASRIRNIPTRNSFVSTANLAKKVPRKSNPLAKMLREKQKADTNGYGTAAFSAAAELVASDSDMYDDLDGDLLSMNDPTAGIGASSQAEMGADLDHSCCANGPFNEARVEELLGAKDGQAVGKILNHDRDNRPTNFKPAGIDFFKLRSKTAVKAPENAVHTADLLADDTTDAVFNMLSKAVSEKDVVALEMILDVGIFGQLKSSNLSCFIHWLFGQVFTSIDTSLDGIAYRVLSVTSYSGLQISSVSLLSALLRLGADRELLAKVAPKVSDNSQCERMDDERRNILTYRWISLVCHFARTGALLDIPSVIVFLLLIALDRSTSSVLERHAIIAIDEVGQSLPSDASDAEITICVQVLKLASELSLANKCNLVSLLGGGCPPMGRISRWISLAILISEDVLPKDHLNHPLPIALISQLLAAPLNSGDIFDIRNSDKMNYDDVFCHVTILGIALSDIDGQVKDESGATIASAITLLESVCTQLTALHGKIVDTRAAHLDRSRAKQALQNLSFRIRYQTTAAKRSAKTSNPEIQKYFTKK